MSIVAEAPSGINRLALEQVVAEAIQAIRANDRNSLECARKGGEALQTLKDDGARGEWLKFLARLQMSASTAASWRRVAHFWEKLNLQRAASLASPRSGRLASRQPPWSQTSRAWPGVSATHRGRHRP